MEKLTDEQIVKALELCGNQEACSDCSLGDFGGIDKCIPHLLLSAFDLINRKDEMLNAQASKIFLYEDVLKQKMAEIERLTVEVEQWKEEANKYQNLWCDLWCEPDSDIHKVKAEAIKMFAGKLKAISHPYGDTQMVFELQIDNLVKEMTDGKDINVTTK